MRITDVFIGEHPLWEEFCAKMIAYPTISTEFDNAIFQGVNRSSIQLLHNYYAGKYMDCEIDYFGTVIERNRNRSALEALLIAPEPVKIDFGDGFFYMAVLEKNPSEKENTEVFSSVNYRFRVTRHTDPISVQIPVESFHVYCQSTVPLTDCRLTIPFAAVQGYSDLVVVIAGEQWGFGMEITGNLVLDGINKVFTMGGNNITNDNDFYWNSFPALKPGKNLITLGSDGAPADPQVPMTLYYTPTFL